MRQRERVDLGRPAVVLVLVLTSIVTLPSCPCWSGSVARAQAACGVAAQGDDPGEDGFQVDGQFYSGPDADDWAEGSSYGGVILDSGAPDPAHESALRERDESCAGVSTDCSMFEGSGNRNNDDVSPGSDPWPYYCGASAQKNDLTDLCAHARVFEVGGSTEVWLILSALTRGVTGEGHIDFEWNVAGLEQVPSGNRADGQVVGLGPDAGRTADVDFIVSVDIVGGGIPPEASVRRWTDVGGAYEYVVFDPGPGNIFVCVDEAGAVAPPWGVTAPDGSLVVPPATITPYQFVEVAVELTSIGIDPADLESDRSTLVFKTRTSMLFTSYLIDFALFPFAIVDPSAGVSAAERPGLALDPPLPNPAIGGATLRFEIPEDAGPARLAVYNARGQLVRELVDARLPRGRHEARWDGIDGRGERVSAGVYFYRVEATGVESGETYSRTGKLVVVK